MSCSYPSAYETTLILSMYNLSVAALPWHNPDDIRPPPPAIFKHSERKFNDYMHSQPEFNAAMRAILINQLIKFHDYAYLERETLYLAISIFDRFLEAETETIAKDSFEYVVIAALVIATKYEQVQEFTEITIECFVWLANYLYKHRTYELEQVLAMEKRILARLQWKIHVPTPYFFLPWYIKAIEYPTGTTMENLVYFYAELGMLKYEILNFYPSMVGAAAVYAARATLNKRDVWHETLEKHTGFKEMEVMECAKMLVRLHSLAKNDGGEVYSKYSYATLDAVARYPPAKSLLAVASTVSSEFGDYQSGL